MMKTSMNGKPLEIDDIPTEIRGEKTGKSKSSTKSDAQK
jgi:hypothetical protein